jgi:UDP-N-acetylglucosamine--N-acetylmuramyl-(pentapeptide) pyrophosphoryl-undecaprenol N-acetylglucosamine transferase
MPLSVLLAGGGTAGHTSPLLATAEALRDRNPAVTLTCLGTERGIETRVIPQAGLPLELIPPVPLPRRPTLDLARVPGRLRGAVRSAGDVLDRIRPDVVVGFGGYVALPAYFAARRRRVPIVIHEGNAMPGLANKIGVRFTRHVATSFPDTSLSHAVFTGLPIRRLISNMDRYKQRAEGRAEFGLDPERPTLLVTGGSQGARRINHAVAGASRALADAGIQVLHHAGRVEEADVSPRDGDPAYIVTPYIERMDLAYAAADLIVCRAGANTVTEVACAGLPAAFCPLAHGNGEQARNARPVVEAGGALLVDDDAMSSDWVTRTVPEVLSDPERLEAMSRAMTDLLPRDADVRLAAMVEAVARGEE